MKLINETAYDGRKLRQVMEAVVSDYRRRRGRGAFPNWGKLTVIVRGGESRRVLGTVEGPYTWEIRLPRTTVTARRVANILTGQERPWRPARVGNLARMTMELMYRTRGASIRPLSRYDVKSIKARFGEDLPLHRPRATSSLAEQWQRAQAQADALKAKLDAANTTAEPNECKT